jgi:hypothetical protein
MMVFGAELSFVAKKLSKSAMILVSSANAARLVFFGFRYADLAKFNDKRVHGWC